jgi:hypothetical protein
LECKTRYGESYLYPKLPHVYVPDISLTPPRSHSGSVVNIMNDVDGQAGHKPK